MNADTKEIRDRVRRIETRLTTFLVAQGVDTGAQKPRFEPHPGQRAYLHLPSRHTSIEECRAAIPDTYFGAVTLLIGGEELGTLSLARTAS